MKDAKGGNKLEEYKEICCFESLYQAHKKARRGKQDKKEIIQYECFLTENLMRLSWHLENKIYRPGGYHRFVIYDPKIREIQAPGYGDRIVQHALCDCVLGPYLDRRLIYDNAACRPGKGTHFAMVRLSGFLRDFYKKHGNDGWILKCDIRKYFASIDHKVLKEKLSRTGLCSDTKWLLDVIIDSCPGGEGRGLPMGNQTSQWFALFYMDGLDRLVKEKLRIPYYTRYMDDMILVHHDKDYLQYCLQQMQTYAKQRLHLEMNEKTQIHHIRQGVDYLGFHFWLNETGKVVRTLRQQSKKRIKRKLRAYRRLYAEGRLDIRAAGKSLASYYAHLGHGDTWHLRQNISKNFVLQRKKDQSQGTETKS